MSPVDVQIIGEYLALRWGDGQEKILSFQALRNACPCAGCKGETDIMGQLHKGPTVVVPPSGFQLKRLIPVGSYGVQPVWGDGHSTGIFTFNMLQSLGG